MTDPAGLAVVGAEALALASAGWPVVPLHTPIAGGCDCSKPDCSSPGKHPRTKNGLSDATTDADQIRRWWGMWPQANIGAVVPDGYVVVDVDVADIATLFAADELPQTAASRTGRGWHYIYRTQVTVRPKVDVRKHVDLRGPGSYIVVPPSLHVSGVRYEWIVPIEAGVADSPAWLTEVVAGREFVSARLTPAAYQHGLALALPEEVVMVRPTRFELATFGFGGRRSIR